MSKKTLTIGITVIGVLLLVTIPFLWLKARRSAALEPYAGVCNGSGLAQATAYTGGRGLHPIVFLATDGTPGAWSDQLPKGWEPVTLAETELVACGEEEERLLEVCPYAGGSDVRRYQYVARIVLRSATTGEQLGLLTVQGEPPRTCAAEESVNVSRLDGSHVDFDEIKQWLSGYVETGNAAVFTILPTAGKPGSLIYADGHLWVITSEGLSELSVAGENQLIPIDSATSIMFDGANFWAVTIVDYGKHEIKTVDPRTGQRGQTYNLSDNMTPLVYDGQRLWLTNGHAVQALNLQTGQYGAAAILGEGFSEAIFDGDFLWITSRDNNVVIQFDPQQERVVAEVPVGNYPSSVLYADQKVWVANKVDDTVQSIDPATAQAGDPIPVGDMPDGLVFDGQHIWVINTNSMSLQVIDTTTYTAEPPISVDQPHSLVFDGEHLWVISGETVQYFTPPEP